MKVKKVIKFQYFRLKFHHNDDKYIYDIRHWLSVIEPLSLKDRIEDIKGYPSRLEYAELIEDSYIHMRFLKMTESFLPELAFNNAKTVPLQLDDDEYIAMDVNTLYDTETHVFMIQNNRGSLSAERIRDYIYISGINHGVFNVDDIITIEPILDKKDIKKLGKKQYKRIEVHFDNVKAKTTFSNNSVDKVLRTIKSTGGNTGILLIGLGRGSSKEGLYEESTEAFIDEICNSECTSSANISIKDDYETYKYDLFDNIMADYKVFELEIRTSLGFKVVRDAMLTLYKKHKENLKISISV